MLVLLPSGSLGGLRFRTGCAILHCFMPLGSGKGWRRHICFVVLCRLLQCIVIIHGRVITVFIFRVVMYRGALHTSRKFNGMSFLLSYDQLTVKPFSRSK